MLAILDRRRSGAAVPSAHPYRRERALAQRREALNRYSDWLAGAEAPTSSHAGGDRLGESACIGEVLALQSGRAGGMATNCIPVSTAGAIEDPAQRNLKDRLPTLGNLRGTVTGASGRLSAENLAAEELAVSAVMGSPAVGLASEVAGFVPTVPDWALDGHTIEGKRMGRGLAYFREHSAKLVPPAKPDVYEAEAYRLLEVKQRKVRRDLFDE
jgi:hypothetical protein